MIKKKVFKKQFFELSTIFLQMDRLCPQRKKKREMNKEGGITVSDQQLKNESFRKKSGKNIQKVHPRPMQALSAHERADRNPRAVGSEVDFEQNLASLNASLDASQEEFKQKILATIDQLGRQLAQNIQSLASFNEQSRITNANSMQSSMISDLEKYQ